MPLIPSARIKGVRYHCLSVRGLKSAFLNKLFLLLIFKNYGVKKKKKELWCLEVEALTGVQM